MADFSEARDSAGSQASRVEQYTDNGAVLCIIVLLLYYVLIQVVLSGGIIRYAEGSDVARAILSLFTATAAATAAAATAAASAAAAATARGQGVRLSLHQHLSPIASRRCELSRLPQQVWPFISPPLRHGGRMRGVPTSVPSLQLK